MKIIHWISLSLLGLALAACAPAPARVQPLPTLLPSPTAAIELNAAQRVAANFVDAWQRFSYSEMYGLLSFASQEATPFDAFQKAYEDAHNVMTLESLLVTPVTLVRQGGRVVVLHYDVKFQTRLLGEIVDEGRDLYLVSDPQQGDSWRIAWSLGDIFAEMGSGAVLRFESRLPSRANIYDRNGVVLADQNGIAVNVRVIQENVVDLPACLSGLAAALDRPVEVIQGIFDRSGMNWVMDVGVMEVLAYDAYHAQLERDCAATFSQRTIRQYPRGSLMPHILGNVGYPEPEEVSGLVQLGFNQETILGRSGIERSWDETLRGKPGGRLALIAPNGVRLRVLAEVETTLPESLWLTIDSRLQEYVLRVLGEAWVDAAAGWGSISKGGAAIILDIKTGEILAMASYPTYEGNAFNPFPAVGQAVAREVIAALAEDERVPQLNRAAQATYPAGSTWKVVDAIAVADSGIYAYDRAYVCGGVWQQGNDRRFDWLAGGHGRVTIASALTTSCNPFFYEVGYQMDMVDPFLLPSYARRLGLGSATGLGDLPEAAGRIIDPDWVRTNRGWGWSYSDAVNMAIGQGESEVTPLQLVRLYAGIANGGDLIRPYLVREKGILNQRTRVAVPTVNGNFDVKPEVLELVRGGLCDVTTAYSGTATHIFVNSPLLNLGVCAKTGTATSGPPGVPPHSWFVTWSPKDDPQIATVVLVETAGDGSAIAAPITRRILEYYYFGPFD